MEIHNIETNLREYLIKQNIKLKKVGTVLQLQCPFCKNEQASAIIPARCNFVNCFACNAKKKTIYDVVRVLIKKDMTDEEVIQHIKETLNLNIVTKKDKDFIDEVLAFYKENKFDLVAVAKDKKNPIELDWVNKEHIDPAEWRRWLTDGINIGIKTGKRSNLTIIDVDQKPVPKEILALVGDTFMLETSKGYQFYYKYVSDLPKTRIEDLKIDIENDGGQCVAYPSIVSGVQRKIAVIKPVLEMSKELLDYLKQRTTVPLKSFSEKLKEDIETEQFNLGLLQEGNRNASLLKLGGILRKKLSEVQTEEVLHVLNNHICPDPLPAKEIHAMVKSLSKYTSFDEQELAHKVLSYLKDVEEANRTEIAMAVVGTNKGEEKQRIDKSLKYLVKEGYVLKKGNRYAVIKRLDWNEDLLNIGVPVDFKMPYFHDIANFNYGDLLVIGSKNKRGKTHISMNMVKRLVEQGVTPYYINLETGSRFAKIALQLGLKNGDFKHSFCADPTQVELEKNAVTIIDWLLIADKSQTDLVFKHFIEQLDKQGGVLIVFQQLKEDNSWFAPNMITQFPALGAKYIYDNENDGLYGKFIIDPIREPKSQIKSFEIPCKYNWDTKELVRIDETQSLDTQTETKQQSEIKSEDIQIDEQEMKN